MADDAHVIRGIHWRQAFPFTNVFRAFRVAIHPSKLLLGLLLLLALYACGRTLDAVWPVRSLAVEGEPAARADRGEDLALNAAAANPGSLGEVEQYERYAHAGGARASFGEWRDARLKENDARWSQMLLGSKLAATPKEADDLAAGRKKAADLKAKMIGARDDRIVQVRKEYADADKAADAVADAKEKALAKKRAADERDAAITDAQVQTGRAIKDVGRLEGQGLFAAFFKYQVAQVTNVARGVLGNNWTGEDGVLASVLNFFTVGPVWLLWVHPVYFVVFAVLFLILWSLFGGAISRIAAVHVARDEKISIRQAVSFSFGKFLSFASAPVIPMLIVLVIGLVVTAVAVLGNIPVIGPVVIGAAFVLAILAGVVMTVVLLGTFGGFNLMYPTIAVEGSDSFDAISRSFSYVYARPWRMLLYTLVAVVYGAATYLFVHLFIWLALTLAHTFVGIGWVHLIPGGRHAFDVLWPNPATHPSLTYDVDYSSLNNWGEKTAAVLIQFWVMLFVAFLGAFAISFYFSANTIIYYLMRQEVDATELDDVYLEQTEDEFADPIPADAPTDPATIGGTASAPPVSGGGVVVVPQPPPAV